MKDTILQLQVTSTIHKSFKYMDKKINTNIFNRLNRSNSSYTTENGVKNDEKRYMDSY